jgi:hypothetical protein
VANRNCLDGLQCPECGNLEPLYIYATSEFEVWDNGTESHTDVEWDDDSGCHCRVCDFRGPIRDFRKEKDGK